MSQTDANPKRKRGRPRKQIVLGTDAALVALAGAPGADANAILMQAIAELREQNARLAERLTQAENFGGIGAAIAEGVAGAIGKQHKLLYKSNEEHPRISAFSYPEGDVARPKPKWHRQAWLNGAKEDPEMLKPVEIDTYNELSKKLRTPHSRVELYGGQWIARVDASDRNMHLTVPCKALEQLMNLPKGLVLIVREFIEGEGAADPLFLLEGASKVKDLEQQIRELRAIIEAGGRGVAVPA